MTNFYLFLLFYAVLTGFGYGLIYMLPLKSAWSFFPGRKGTVGGLILSSHSFGAIWWSYYTATTMNPLNEVPNLYINIGNSLEALYTPTSGPALNVAYTLRMVFLIELVLLIFGLILIHKKEVIRFK